jgi:hypothetical protein
MFNLPVRMKINKVILSVMLFVFTVSTTGVPLFVHLCKTMNKASFNSCEMCKVNKQTKGIFIGREHNCCEGKALLSPNPEQYVSLKDYKVSPVTFSNVIIPDISGFNQQYLISKVSIFDSSPPGAVSNSLYLDNSILLI